MSRHWLWVVVCAAVSIMSGCNCGPAGQCDWSSTLVKGAWSPGTPDSCGIGATTISFTTDGVMQMTPFGVNGTVTVDTTTSTGFGEVNPSGMLTILDAAGHTCRLGCVFGNQLQVTCTNKTGGKCTTTLTRK